MPAPSTAELRPVTRHGRIVLRYLQALAIVLLGTLASLGALHLQQRAEEQQQTQALESNLRRSVAHLQQQLTSILADNQSLAEQLSAEPDMSQARKEALASALRARHPRVSSIGLTDGFRVTFVHPRHGNESILGLDYSIQPEQLGDIQRSITLRRQTLAGPFRTLQSNRLGLAGRAPFFDQEAPDQWLGLSSVIIDLQAVLQDAALAGEQAKRFQIALRALDDDGHGGPAFLGDPELFQRAQVLLPIDLPETRWQLAAISLQPDRENTLETALLIATCLALSLALGSFWLWRNANMTTAQGRQPVSLRTLMLGTLGLALLPVVGLGAWLAYYNGQQTAGQYTEQLAANLVARTQDRLHSFFDVPRRALALNVELARSDLLLTREPERMREQLLLQLRQYPLLTFLSVGLANGEYYAGSRPPLGDDRGLRMLQAREADQRQMQIYRVDASNRRGSLVSSGATFDARQRPWFKAAQAKDSMAWYPVYTYAIHDQQNAYSTQGIGISSPLRDSQGNFLGVGTADIALGQLSQFLADLSADSHALVFLSETDGQLLAVSDQSPLYRAVDGKPQRYLLDDSPTPLLRAAADALKDSGQSEGHALLEQNGQTYRFDWRRHNLAQGPQLVLGVLTPNSQFLTPMQDLLRNLMLLTLGVLGLALLMALYASDWLTRPLGALGHWASRLAAGDWQAAPPNRSPIREVHALTQALDGMARQLRHNTSELEQRVAQRTAELQLANQQLAALSRTDGLTGLANRRHFDEMLIEEWNRAARNGQSLALLMLDVDYFKSYNDHLGHLAGDECLRAIASVLQSCARRAGDHAARYGGEEFAVIASDCDALRAMQMAQTILNVLATLNLPHPTSQLGRISLSIGVAVLQPGPEGDPQRLIQQADQALYQAKYKGRNRAEYGQPDPS